MADYCVLIDGNSIMYRMYFGVRDMSNAKGFPTNAIYGFVNHLINLTDRYKPAALAVAFDLPTATFRHDFAADYKAGREKMPEDLAVQFEALKALLGDMGVAMVSLSGFEADDVIGTLSCWATEAGMETRIVTGDRDSFQLIDESVHVLYTTTRSGNVFTEMTPESIMDKYGVSPKALIQVKGLMGDSSDNIPGIAGIGEKTATKLIAQYGDLETLYDHLDDLKGKQKEKITNGRQSAFDSRYLGTICRDCPLELTMDDLRVGKLFTPSAVERLRELEFSSIIKRLNLFTEPDKPSKEGIALSGAYQSVDKTGELYGLLQSIMASREMVLSVEQIGDRHWLAVAVADVVTLMEDASVIRGFLAGLGEIPNGDEIAVVGHDLKKLAHYFEAFGATIANFAFDTMIAAYLLDPADSRYDLESLGLKYLEMTLPSREEIFGKGAKVLSEEAVDGVQAADFVVKCCRAIALLRPILTEKLEKSGMMALYQEIELRLIPVLSDMEAEGFKVDGMALERLSETFESRLQVVTEKIYEAAGHPFTINSPKQLGQVLYEELSLPIVKKGKTGYSTAADVLEELRIFHPIVDDILDYRMLAKLDSTYGRGLMRYVNPNTEKIYTTLNQTVTATGRLSSSDPNLQNIPARTEMGREIRRVFIPSAEDRVLIDGDYSQIELRVLAHLSGDENLIDTFVQGEDVHTRTASEIFSVPREVVTSLQRSRAKAVNFGLIYGKQAFSLAKELGITRKDAQSYIDMYFARYPKVQAYMTDVVAEAKEKGYVETLWGRRRSLPELHSKNGLIVKSGERMALNTPIQGTAADIIKIAMIRVDERLKKSGLDAKLILQVHDELILDVHRDDSEAAMALLLEEMEHAVTLAVPLIVDVHMGRSWLEVK